VTGAAGTGPAAAAAALAEHAAPAAGLGELAAEAQRARVSYGGDALIVCDRLVRIYSTEGVEVQALQGLDLLVAEGELTALVGASGSGKSTLMNILAGLDAPTAGTVRVAGHDLAAFSARQRLGYRRGVVGFIWQQASQNLLSYLTGRQNVIMPMRLTRVGRAEQGRRADELLAALQVTHCADRLPDRMSGGEQQRTAIAVALANQPRVLLADEPTGQLDTRTAADVLAALRTANTELGVTVLVVSHDPAVAAGVHRTVAIRDGRTSTETLRQATTDDLGNAAQHVVEYAVMDRAGRVQLPRGMTRALGMRDRVRLESESDHIGVWPDEPPRPAGPAQPPGSAPPLPGPPGGPADGDR
jgi:ABC-type lipoprotein export system ATPase subunit